SLRGFALDAAPLDVARTVVEAHWRLDDWAHCVHVVEPRAEATEPADAAGSDGDACAVAVIDSECFGGSLLNRRVLPALRQLRNVGLLRWGGCRAVVPQRARLVAALAVVGAPPVALPSGATLDVSALDGLDAADAHASLRGGRAVEADLAAALADGTVALVTPPATVFVVDFGVEQLPGPGDARTTTLDFVVAADAPARGALAV
ncbi:hypothetical protein AURANDRAFT_69173, partial [Aureococcus anophagefferens]